MSKLTITSAVEQLPWHLPADLGPELTLEEELRASGGYGQLFELQTTITHSLPSPTKWLVKLCSAEIATNETGFERICRLFSLLRDWQQQLQYDIDEVLLYYAPFIGFPQAAFTCEWEDQKYYGYLMPDLASLGFVPFDDLSINHPEEYIDELRKPEVWQASLKGVHSLAKTLELLHDAFNFIHGDLKAESIWYHPERKQFAMIDYDGGSFRRSFVGKFWSNLTEPKIKGAIQAWLAPEIMKASDDGAAEARWQVTSYSDYWAFACGVFHLLSGVVPFVFLQSDIYKTRQQYHKHNIWPSLEPIDSLLSFDAGQRAELEGYLSLCRPHTPIWQLFVTTFNTGFAHKEKRPGYTEWVQALAATVADKTSALTIRITPQTILEGEEATLTWQCADGHLFVNGVNYKNGGERKLNLQDYPSLKMVNAFGEWPVSVPLEIIKKPRVRSVTSSAPFVKWGDAVELQWDVAFAEKIIVSSNGVDSVANTNPFSFVPNASQEVSLWFYSKNNLHVETRSLSIEVVKPVEIAFFRVDRAFIAETLPVTFSWQMENADEFSITGVERKLESTGEVTIRPKQSGEYTLIASNKFFKTKQSLYIEVLPVPKIDHLPLPQLPELNVQLPDLTGNVPEFMRRLSEPQSIFKKIFDEQDN